MAAHPSPEPAPQRPDVRLLLLPLPEFTLLPFGGFLDKLRFSADDADRSRQRHCAWTLLGIDAPEICQSQGAEARQALITLALNRPVQVTVRARDRYGRALATVERAEDGLDLSHAMVTGGWAWADRFRRQQAALEQDEGVARAQRRGVFRQSDAEPPADFRRRHGPCVAAKR